jgi:membrane protein YqaA with SNARE-associated domain
MSTILLVFLIVLALNVIPAFAPPTWMVFSFLGFRFPEHAGWVLALTGALAATLGRCTLAKMSRVIVRRRWLSAASRENVDALRDEIQKRPRLTFGVLLFYAFTPLPSNSVFIAYGLTTMNIFRIAVPFFLGRFVSYTFWTKSAAAVSSKFNANGVGVLGYFSVYFVLTQFAFLGVVYVFTRIDWNVLIRERKWKWFRKESKAVPKMN